MKILMVCLGNICRSPLAQGIMEDKVRESNLKWQVDSAGTSAYHIGEKPDPRSISTAAERGLDITAQRARQFEKKDFERFDIIYAMDKSNYNDILQHANTERARQKVKLILNEAFPGQNRDVPDPYWNDKFYEVYDMLDKSCQEIISKYKNQ